MDSERRTIDSIHIKGFTAFSDLRVEFSPGINAIIGNNSTGKTHLLKYLHVMFGASQDDERINERLIEYFLPLGSDPNRLVNYKRSEQYNFILAKCGSEYKAIDYRWQKLEPEGIRKEIASDHSGWKKFPVDFFIEYRKEFGVDLRDTRPSDARMMGGLQTNFIPTSEILSHAKGFRSLYSERWISFDKSYPENLDKAFLPPLKELDPVIESVTLKIERTLGGRVEVRSNDEVFLVLPDYSLEFTLVAEGYRKFALLWLLIKTGSIAPGTVLFWDEPEANLNPKLMIELMKILLMLERLGVQIFFTTHDYILLKYLDLLRTDENKVRFHSLYRDEEGEIANDQADLLIGLEHNAIFDVFDDIYSREMKRAAERIKID